MRRRANLKSSLPVDTPALIPSLTTARLQREMGELLGGLTVHFAWYNFCRVHRTLRVIREMKAGITGHISTLRDLIRGVMKKHFLPQMFFEED